MSSEVEGLRLFFLLLSTLGETDRVRDREREIDGDFDSVSRPRRRAADGESALGVGERDFSLGVTDRE